jgi:3-methyladenine DNA glycosylase AlkD
MSVQSDLQRLADPQKAAQLARYFKTGKGEYGEGDVFIGVVVPKQRMVARRYKDIPLSEIKKMLHNKIHEFRLTALLILVYKFEKADESHRKLIYDLYLASTAYINNWDLVDLSSHEIVGEWLIAHPSDRSILTTLAKSGNIWERRIAMISTFAFLRVDQYDTTLKIAEILLQDEHDLIHKAVGWGLREVGKRNLDAEEKFLKKYYSAMPRTMLRYAIEKLSEEKRHFYLR